MIVKDFGGQEYDAVDKVKEDVDVVKDKLVILFNQFKLAEKLQEFDDTLNKQAMFYRNWMTMFEGLLLILCSTKQRCWELHLASLHQLVKYFFVHDQQNYAQMVVKCPNAYAVLLLTHKSFE